MKRRLKCVRKQRVTFFEHKVGSRGGDVIADICSGFVHAGSQVASLRDAAIELFPACEVNMWIKTQSVCVEQRQELPWHLQQSEKSCDFPVDKRHSIHNPSIIALSLNPMVFSRVCLSPFSVKLRLGIHLGQATR